MLSNTLTETWKWHLVHQVGMTPISAMPHRWQHHHFQIATNACCQLIATTINRSKATLKKLWEYHVVNYVLVHIINHINYILSKTPTSSTSDLVMLTSLMYCPWCWFVVSTSESPPTFPTTNSPPCMCYPQHCWVWERLVEMPAVVSSSGFGPWELVTMVATALQ